MSIKKLFQTRKRRMLTSILSILIVAGAAIILWTVFGPGLTSDIDPSYAKVAVPAGEASDEPLRSEAAFTKAMKNYPVIKESIDGNVPLPGIYSSYGLRKKADKAYELVKSENYTPQGITISDRYIFISAYDHEHKLNSVIFMIDYRSGKYVKTIGLDNKAHVGGLGYDLQMGILWVSDSHGGKAVLSGINQADIDEYDMKEKEPIFYTAKLTLDTIKAASTVEFHKNNLLVGYFSQKSGGGQIQVFKTKFEKGEDGTYFLTAGNAKKESYTKSGVWHISANSAYSVPAEVQGLAVDDGYLFMSRSFGNKDSKITRYSIQVNGSKVQFGKGETVKAPPYLEQVAITRFRPNGKDKVITVLFPLFESSQINYRRKTNAFVDRIFGISEATFDKYAKKDKASAKPKSIPVKAVTGKSS
ncbi:hypothetical protein OfM1_08330 [Lactovum odontotermitis]